GRLPFPPGLAGLAGGAASPPLSPVSPSSRAYSDLSSLAEALCAGLPKPLPRKHAARAAVVRPVAVPAIHLGSGQVPRGQAVMRLACASRQPSSAPSNAPATCTTMSVAAM